MMRENSCATGVLMPLWRANELGGEGKYVYNSVEGMHGIGILYQRGDYLDLY